MLLKIKNIYIIFVSFFKKFVKKVILMDDDLEFNEEELDYGSEDEEEELDFEPDDDE